MSDPLEIDVFWSFRSPWSYLATPRLREWQERYALTVRFRPVYPLAIRTPEFFDKLHPLWPSYFFRDLFRVAEMLGLPMARPQPDPVAQEARDGRLVTGREQPYIHRLTRLGALAQERGHGIEFADEVSRVIWSGTPNWHEGDHLARAAQRAARPGRPRRRGGARGGPDRARDRAEPEGPRGGRTLGRAHLRVPRGAVLRPGPARRAVVALAPERPPGTELTVRVSAGMRSRMVFARLGSLGETCGRVPALQKPIRRAGGAEGGSRHQASKRYASPSRTRRPAVGPAKWVPITSTGVSA